MKLSKETLRILPLVVIAFIAGVIISCVHRGDPSDARKRVNEINDTLRSGHIKDAIELTEALKREALSVGDSQLWCESMLLQGVNAYYQSKPELLSAVSDSALTWLCRQPVTEEIAQLKAKGYQTKGAYFDQFAFNPDSSLKYLRLSVDNVEISGHASDLPQYYGNYANALRMAAMLDSAAFYYHRAISVADSLNMSTVHYIPLYNGIASVLTDMHDFENSTMWWKKSLDILDDMSQYDKFNTLTGYGNNLYYYEDFEGANRVFNQLKDMLDSLPDAQWERIFNSVNLADTEIRLGRTDGAAEVLDSAARYFSDVQPNPVASSYIQTLQMRKALVDKDYSGALRLVERYPPDNQMRLEQLLARLQVMEDIYKATGRYKDAYEMETEYVHLNDSLRSYKLKQQISALNAMYQRDRRILNLQTERKGQEARIFRLFALMALSVAITVGLILFIILRRGRMHRREEKMMQKIVSLRQENLRNRITPHFIYNALNHELARAVHGSPYHLDSLVRLIRRQQYIASEMIIPFKEELSFVGDYIHVMSDGLKIRPEYRCSIPRDMDLEFLFPSMALQILVENAFKHGFASLTPDQQPVLVISVNREGDDRIAVTVFNNTGTREVATHGSGTGLRVLVETIRLINERNKEKTLFTINTESEFDGLTGCVVTITIPIMYK